MAIVRQITSNTYFNIPDEELDKYSIPEDKTAAVLKENNILLGVAGEPPEGAEVMDLEPLKMEAADASASYMRWATAICPRCAAANRVLEDTQRYLWFRCGRCGGRFRF